MVDKGLGLGGLCVSHDAGSVFVGVDGDYLIVPDPEPLPPPGEVDVLGREAQHAGVGVYCFVPLYGPAVEGDGPIVEAPGDADADPVGGALALPSRERIQVGYAVDDPDELLGLQEVEWAGAVDVLAVGNLADDRGQDDCQWRREHVPLWRRETGPPA